MSTQFSGKHEFYPSRAAQQITSGLIANIPVAGVADRYYWATDIYVLFRDTGAAWEVVAEQPYARTIWGMWDQGSIAVTTPVGVGDVYYVPIQIPFTVTIDALGCCHGGVAGGNLRQAIYLDNGDTIAGATLLSETASTPVNGVTRKQETALPANLQLTPAIYWLGLQTDQLLDEYHLNLESNDFSSAGTLQSGYFRNAGGYGAFEAPQVSALNVAWAWVQYVRVLSIP